MCLQYLFSVCVCDVLCARHVRGAYQMPVECVNDSVRSKHRTGDWRVHIRESSSTLYTLKRPCHVCCLDSLQIKFLPPYLHPITCIPGPTHACIRTSIHSQRQSIPVSEARKRESFRKMRLK